MRKSILFIVLLVLVIVPSSFAQKENSKSKDNEVALYITRHGKTILNTTDRVQGWADAPLTPAGIEVAEYLGKGLKEENIKFIAAYSSDLGRARQTARVVLNAEGQHDLPITEIQGLREVCFGSYEGEYNQRMWNDAALYLHYKSGKELLEALKNDLVQLSDIVNTFKTLETLGIGENYNEVKARGQKALRKIAEKEAANGGGNILIVGHGMSIWIFLSDLDSYAKKPKSKQMGNATISKVIFKDGKFSLESFGDQSFIDKGKKISHK